MSGIITIKPQREKPVRNRHPWVYSGAIARVEGSPQPGDIVTLVSQQNEFLGRGYYNPKSQIAVRILTWEDEEINTSWWQDMLGRAIDGRVLQNWRQQHQHSPYGYRLVNAENDFLPGLIIDRYGDWLVLQALTLHIDLHKMMICDTLVDLLDDFEMPVKGIYERSDVEVRGKEGLHPVKGLLWGEEPPELIPMQMEKLTRLVDVRSGHKTGYYLDQLPNQDFSVDFFETDPSVRLLNCFSYTGGFGLASAASVTNVDSSFDALELAEKTYQLNYRDDDADEFIQADVFEYLRDMRDEGEQYDIVILDPPKFAQSAAQVERAARGYKDINLSAFHVIKPGGHLMTFSCSGAVSTDLFQKIVFGALADSGRQAQILKHLGPGDDHPVALTFPEGAYLKGLLLRVY